MIDPRRSAKPRLSWGPGINLVVDGNSNGAGYAASQGYNWVNTILAPRAPISSQISVGNVAISGQTLAQMAANHADVDAYWVSGKTNVLLVIEIINSISTNGSASQTAADMAAYCAAVKSVHPWKIVAVTGGPRYQAYGHGTVAQLNQEIINANARIIQDQRVIGLDGVADIRFSGSVFNYSDYSLLSNYNGFSTADGSDSNGPIRVHYTDAQYAWICENAICPALTRLRK